MDLADLLSFLLRSFSFISDVSINNIRKKFRPILDSITVEYLESYGFSANDWLKNQIHGFNKAQTIALNNDTIDRIANHIVNGHISAVRELLWIDLIQQGHNRDRADEVANYIFTQLVLRLAPIKTTGSDSELGASQKIPKEARDAILSDRNRRLICVHCYRVIREWKEGNSVEEGMGPSQVQCKRCKQVTPTFLTPWNKKSKFYKVMIYTVPAFLIVAGVMISVFLRIPNDSFKLISGFPIILGLFMVFYAWWKSNKSLTTPIW